MLLQLLIEEFVQELISSKRLLTRPSTLLKPLCQFKQLQSQSVSQAWLVHRGIDKGLVLLLCWLRIDLMPVYPALWRFNYIALILMIVVVVSLSISFNLVSVMLLVCEIQRFRSRVDV